VIELDNFARSYRRPLADFVPPAGRLEATRPV
jgi:hypothetical protein